MLNKDAGYEADVTVNRTAEDEFLIVSGTATAVRDLVRAPCPLRVRVELIGHLKPCMTKIYLHNLCAHGRLYPHAPVHACAKQLI